MSEHIGDPAVAAAWDEEGEHWAAHADRYDAASAAISRRLLDALVLEPGDEVLDVGCGCAASTIAVARRLERGTVLGVDLSAPMLRVARERAARAGVENVSFLRSDVQVHPFDDGQFDVVISEFGTMFFPDAKAAFANIARSMRARARLTMLVWQSFREQEWLRTILGAVTGNPDLPGPPPDVPSPFALARPEYVHDVLAAAGLADVQLADVREPMRFGDDGDDAYEFLVSGGPVKGALESSDDPEAARTRLHDALVDATTADGVVLNSAAWLIAATRP